MPKIAVVIPTVFNRPAYLYTAFKSISQQAGDFDLEILIGCPAHLIEAIQRAIPQATVVAEPASGGLGHKLGELLNYAAARSDFLAWLGDDDLLTRDSLQAAASVLLADGDVSMVYGGCDYIDASGRVLFTNSSGSWAGKILRFGPQLIPQPGSLIRSKSFIAAGGLADEFNLAFDFDLFLRLQKQGRLVFMNKTLSQFRWHPNSLSVKRRLTSVLEASKVRRKYYRGLTKLAWWIWEPFVIFATWLTGKLVSQKARHLSGS